MTVWATRADQVDLRGPNPHDLARSLGAAYAFDGSALELGALVLDGVANPEARKATVGTFPKRNVYADLGELLTTLGIGVAVVTILSENGAPTPVAWTRLRPPSSVMAQLAPAQQQAMVAASPLQAEDGTTASCDAPPPVAWPGYLRLLR